MSSAAQPPSHSLAEDTSRQLRDAIASGELLPGERLTEADLTTRYGVSRNTLRESFRLLSAQGLVAQERNRGTFVTVPSIASVLDIYRVRRLIETQALIQAFPKHPAVSTMRQAVEQAHEARLHNDWRTVGSANIAFHRAIIALTDSARLTRLFDQLSAELRLAFGLIDDPEYLHAPFLDRNTEILNLVTDGQMREAADTLADYLVQSERILLTAYDRLTTQAR